MSIDFQNYILKIMSMDKLRGAILGLSTGDALGASYELRNAFPLSDYNGNIYQPIKWQPRYKPVEYSVIGSVTDDTTMTIALYWSIIKNQNWVRDDVIKSYMDWANSGIKYLGKNTRALLHGIKTIKGYNDRYNRIDLSNIQSNGSLMRAFPLFLLFSYLPEDQAYHRALDDTNLTNPNPVNRDATLIYLTILRYIQQGTSSQEALPELVKMVQTEPIRDAIINAAVGLTRDVKTNKGWVAHPIYFIIQAWMQADLGKSYSEIINWIILQGGDTDTNAAIAGSILGFYYGEQKLLEDPVTSENIKIVLNADTTQGTLAIDIKYHPVSILESLKENTESTI